ncbi:MAG: MATE family efflux transporter [Bacteroidales bacterium]|nr:MATE family efflux transporter [Bacteroidales bacterium]
METLDRTKELETRDIGSLLWKYALPAVISQIIASIYNIVDRIFIGRGVGALAIAGLAITFPLMNIIHAFGSLIGVGSSARMSIVLGRKDKEWAENILGNSLIFTFILSGLVVLFCYLFMDRILMMFGATAETVAYAREYMVYILPGMFLITVTFNLTGLIRASGYPTKSMLIMAGGAVLNIILDPIFIFALGLGIKGAAIASTISIFCMALVSVLHFVQPDSFIRFRSHCWKLRGYIFRNITLIGMSPFLMNLAAAGVVAILNRQLLRYGGDLAVGAYGICNTYGNFLVLMIIGVCQGMQPIAGYNYGAGHGDRLKHVYGLTMWVCVAIGLFGSVVSCIFPRTMMRLFTTDQQLIEIGKTALRYSMVMFPLIGFTIVNSNFFQSIDKPWVAIVTSLSRQVLFLVPMSLIIPLLFVDAGWDGLHGIWLSLTISDVLGAILAAVLLFTQRQVFSITSNEETKNVETQNFASLQ